MSPTSTEILVRFLVFAGVFLLMAVLEALAPRRAHQADRSTRWITNLSIVGIDVLTVRAMALLPGPMVALAAAVYAERQGIGLWHWLGWIGPVAFVASIIILDLAVWAQHVASHRFRPLWRLHRMHHADIDFDVTTALRFHPIEIALSMLWKVACVLALGASPAAVLAFEVILNSCAIFNHANLKLPGWLDRALRLAVVTPDMHRVHHSVEAREHHTNFGFNLSIWDRLFSTYRAEPTGGQEGMTIGLPILRDERELRLDRMLTQPFRSEREGA